MSSLPPTRSPALATPGVAQLSPRARQRLALISPWRPLPVDNGSKQRIRCIIEALAPEYDLAFMALLPQHELHNAARGVIPGIEREWLFTLPDFQSRSLRSIVAGARGLPRSFASTWDARLAHRVSTCVREFGADAVIGLDLQIIRYAHGAATSLPVILDEANLSQFVIQRERTVSTTERIRAWVRQHKYRRLFATAAVDAAIVSSEIEAAAVASVALGTTARVVENAVVSLPSNVVATGDLATCLHRLVDLRRQRGCCRLLPA